MTIKYEKGELHLDLHEMLGHVTGEQKREMVESLSCDDDITRHVVAQILTRWTESGYCGSSVCTAQGEPYYALDQAWRQIAKRSGEVAKREIERLESALKSMREERDSALQDYRNLRQ